MKKIWVTLFCLLAFCNFLVAEIAILHTQDRTSLRHELVDSVQKAKKSLLFFTFTFSDPGLLSLINEKAKEGLDVTVVIDKEHTLPIKQAAHPSITILTRAQGEGRVHHKILCIDNEEVWLGSLNFT